MGKHKAIMIEKIKEGLYTLQDSEHGLEACGETEEDCMKNLELALKAFEIYDKIKKAGIESPVPLLPQSAFADSSLTEGAYKPPSLREVGFAKQNSEGVYIGLYKLCISGRYHLPVFYLIL